MRIEVGLFSFFMLSFLSLAEEKSTRPRAILKSDTLSIFNEEQKKNSAETKDLITATNILLTKKIPQSQKDVLLLNRANYYLTLTRLDFLKSKTLELSSDGLNSLEIAEADLRALHSLTWKSKDYKAKIYMLEGLAQIYRDQSYEEPFLSSLLENPKSSSAPWISLMLAELYFEREEYVKAQDFYKKYFNNFDPKQKELAIYKLAWCALNTKNYPLSEKYFIQIVEKRSKSEIAKDALKDLGYVMSLHRTDSEIIQAAEIAFKLRPEVHLNFLMSIMSYREARQELRPDSAFFLAITKLEGYPTAKFKLFLSASRSSNKGYASHQHLKAFKGVQSVFTPTLEPEVRIAFRTETEAIIKSFYETYSTKVRSPEAWTKVELNTALRELLDYFIKTFPESTTLAQMIAAKTELCTQVKDFRCMIESQLRILQNPQQRAHHETASFELFKIWDELYKKSSLKFGKRSILAAERFVETFPKSKSWELGARRLAEYYTDSGNHTAAVSILKKTQDKFPSPENFLRLQTSRFKATQYTELLEDTTDLKDSPRIIELRREAALQKAVQDKASGKMAEYERSIATYIESSPSDDKARIARVDYFSTLLEKSEYLKLKEEWMKLPHNEKNQKDYQPLFGQLWMEFFKQGDFRALLGMLPQSTDPSLQYLKLLTQLASGEKVSFDVLKKLDFDKRVYLESLLLLTDYKSLWNYFQTEIPRTDAEKSLAAWSYRLASGTMDIPKNSESLKVLGDSFDFALPEGNFPTLRRRISEVPVPKQGMSMKRFSSVLERTLPDVRYLRKRVASALKKMRGTEQESLSLQMANLEQRLAEAIVASPLPEKLSNEDIATYKSGLAEASKEFFDQAIEFKKIAESSKQQRLAAEFNVPKSEGWPAGEEWSVSKFKSVRELASEKNPMAALVLLDLLNDQKQDKNTYYRVRFKVLRPLWEQSPVLRQYLANELKSAEQLQILEEWKKVPNEV